ncbi:hypothetical protein BN938_2098 [Mucinivorans hirudinis]|uniref:Uncharacterized protein n=1 Tax=Mucinivorans hirudinis TaxID=1433126 RepID=A0A060R993_9BACT|nr:hypothetical protein BN938_2098 [Mucinivorans hirudinis]
MTKTNKVYAAVGTKLYFVPSVGFYRLLLLANIEHDKPFKKYLFDI